VSPLVASCFMCAFWLVPQLAADEAGEGVAAAVAVHHPDVVGNPLSPAYPPPVASAALAPIDAKIAVRAMCLCNAACAAPFVRTAVPVAETTCGWGGCRWSFRDAEGRRHAESLHIAMLMTCICCEESQFPRRWPCTLPAPTGCVAQAMPSMGAIPPAASVARAHTGALPCYSSEVYATNP
jgi:hypothetical protein